MFWCNIIKRSCILFSSPSRVLAFTLPTGIHGNDQIFRECFLYLINPDNKLTPVRTKFLIADDDADDVMLFCEALHQIATAMECYHVENGRELFQFLSDSGAGSPEVIFLDINMPIMNGWECLTRLKGTTDYRTIPIIIYSTSSAKRDIDLAYQLGASLFLTKPEEYRELCSILEIIATTPIDSMLSRLKGFACAKFT